ncbi:hypothetical protein F2Q69_00012764 [Brassica cretica]|uniref:Uncharacterized protein n=1 Tax=Brassica cretica TaxID=69181 RepID=A0A8S9R6T1_BRACR|nr:hypothetical protein F2Q69_00012764 [Brassica cretica]
MHASKPIGRAEYFGRARNFRSAGLTVTYLDEQRWTGTYLEKLRWTDTYLGELRELVRLSELDQSPEK